jgi:hypothetical protein
VDQGGELIEVWADGIRPGATPPTLAKPLIIEVPILRDGRAGRARLFASTGVGIDGGQFDATGTMWVGAPFDNELLRVSRTGQVSVVVTPDQFAPAYLPTNPVFGFGTNRTTLYISGANPSVVKVDVGVPVPAFANETPGRTGSHQPLGPDPPNRTGRSSDDAGKGRHEPPKAANEVCARCTIRPR